MSVEGLSWCGLARLHHRGSWDGYGSPLEQPLRRIDNGLDSKYYLSTHGCSRVCSSFPSVGFCFELVDAAAAAAAAARALLLKKLAAMSSYSAM